MFSQFAKTIGESAFPEEFLLGSKFKKSPLLLGLWGRTFNEREGGEREELKKKKKKKKKESLQLEPPDRNQGPAEDDEDAIIDSQPRAFSMLSRPKYLNKLVQETKENNAPVKLKPVEIQKEEDAPPIVPHTFSPPRSSSVWKAPALPDSNDYSAQTTAPAIPDSNVYNNGAPLPPPPENPEPVPPTPLGLPPTPEVLHHQQPPAPQQDGFPPPPSDSPPTASPLATPRTSREQKPQQPTDSSTGYPPHRSPSSSPPHSSPNSKNRWIQSQPIIKFKRKKGPSAAVKTLAQVSEISGERARASRGSSDGGVKLDRTEAVNY